MAQVVHSINISLSGSCHHEDVIPDEELHQYALDLLRSADSVLLGRNTFDLFADFWPSAVNRRDIPTYMVEFAQTLEKTPKFVLTSSPLNTEWQNTASLEPAEIASVRELIADTSGKILVFGSPILATSLMNAGLINEIHVVLQPIVGSTSTFAYLDLESSGKVSLLEARAFGSGTILLRYETAH